MIDAGAATCAMAIDHDGAMRTADGDRDGTARCDIGAFELSAAVVETAFTLVDADSDRDVRRLSAGEVIERPSLPTAFNVRVDFSGISGIKSVVFELDGALAKTENIAPWALGGDINGDYLATTIATGSHEIVARAHQGPDGSGTELANEQTSFVLRA